MFAVDWLLLVAAVMLLVGIASSKFSSRLGLPVLVLFLGIGMLAGSEGLGGIEFENYTLAHGIGTLSLAVILFDGGLRTRFGTFRLVAAPAVVLATVGVFLTTLITGIAATWMLGIPILMGLLVGSIVGSTDAAAVFAVLRSRGVHLSERLSATLEVESGANDPMAVFLTVTLLQVIQGEVPLGPELLPLFLVQAAIGLGVGLGVGKSAVWGINRIALDAAGLYPVLAAGAGLLAYGLAATLGGSGFLAVYLAGMVIGNSRVVFQRGIFLFHDGAAWLAQIVMFMLLGLLSFPSRLIEAAPMALMVAAALIFVARPVTVATILPWFGYSRREMLLVSWVGLRGAVPIVLATFPLVVGIAGSETLFDVVFFVVLISTVLQGWSLPLVARALRLQETPPPAPPITLEITSLRDIDGDIIDYTATPRSRASGRLIRDLKLPEGAVVAMIARGDEMIPPRGSTRVEAGDHVFVVLRSQVRPLVDRIFSRTAADPASPLPKQVEFRIRGDTTVGDLKEFYDLPIDAPADLTLDALLRGRSPQPLTSGAHLRFGSVSLVARDVTDPALVEHVGLIIRAPSDPDPEPAAAAAAQDAPAAAPPAGDDAARGSEEDATRRDDA